MINKYKIESTITQNYPSNDYNTQTLLCFSNITNLKTYYYESIPVISLHKPIWFYFNKKTLNFTIFLSLSINGCSSDKLIISACSCCLVIS